MISCWAKATQLLGQSDENCRIPTKGSPRKEQLEKAKEYKQD
jgi:hypothetical protein